MTLAQRIDVLSTLGEYLKESPESLKTAIDKAYAHNPWFTPQFVTLATENITTHFLQKDLLQNWAGHYHLDDNIGGRNVGVVMAGNIPLVGFHDFLCVFISGHRQTIKLSGKDNILLKHLVEVIIDANPAVTEYIFFADMLKGCDAYIATGSGNTARYFDYYFSRYPSIIRRNRTSAAILDGSETAAELEGLADDVHLYFGLGCRNVTHIRVPREYDFVPLLRAFDKYSYFAEHDKYKNNYDYYLTLQIMNNRFYMTNGSILLTESEALFSPVGQLNYSFYDDPANSAAPLVDNDEVQCLTGHGHFPFGSVQSPSLTDYADGVDTLQFLLAL